MKRRKFMVLVGGAVTVWPVAARAQQPEQIRRIGVLTGLSADDALAQARNAAFLQGLADLGWRVGRNVQIDFRWGIDTARRIG
jgi:putative ABC transport system substrate-binding protein